MLPLPPHPSLPTQIQYAFKTVRNSPFFVPGTVIGASVIALALFRRKAIGGTYTEKVDLTNKVVIVTGSSGGIGEETARALADMNAHVIMACRDESKARAAITRIRATTAHGRLDFLALDLSDLDSVRDFVEEFSEMGLPLNVLVLNAGVVYGPFAKTKQGHESHFGINHLGHFLLTNLLLNKLIAAKGRIVSVSSGLYNLGRIQFDDLLFQKSVYTPRLAYANSKLANILFINELQNKVKGTGVDAFSLSPGLCKTGAQRNHKGIDKFFLRILNVLIGKTAEHGAQTVIKAAISPELTGKGGAYLTNLKITPLNKIATDSATAGRLWDLSSQLVGMNRDFLAREPSQKVLRMNR